MNKLDQYFAISGLSPWQSWAFMVLALIGVWLVATGLWMRFVERRDDVIDKCWACYRPQCRLGNNRCEHCGEGPIISVYGRRRK